MRTVQYAAKWVCRFGSDAFARRALLPFGLAGLVALAAPPLTALASTSVFETAPAEPRAVVVKGQSDGRADDTDAIQRALDQAADRGGGGVVFLPSGRYRISRTLFVWPGVRLFGVGASR